jgi:hypothetical protein
MDIEVGLCSVVQAIEVEAGGGWMVHERGSEITGIMSHRFRVVLSHHASRERTTVPYERINEQ